MLSYAIRQLKSALKRIYYNYRVNFRSETPVIVYQMGKVGSSSISQSLKTQLDCPVFHVHRMNLQNISAVDKEYKHAGQMPPDETAGIFLGTHVISKNRPARIISLVREPVERNISAFFQNYKRFVGQKYQPLAVELDQLIDRFLTSYNHDVPLTWFDIEMKATTSIDVYQYPFPFDKGYTIIRKPPYELLVIKLETRDHVKEEAVKKFLELDRFELNRHNVGQNKNYALTYQDFKKHIRIPAHYIVRMCASRYTTHFYSAGEIEQIIRKWAS